jgi:hypothetical protein
MRSVTEIGRQRYTSCKIISCAEGTFIASVSLAVFEKYDRSFVLPGSLSQLQQQVTCSLLNHWVPGSLTWDQSGSGLKLTTHFPVVPIVRMSRNYTSTSHRRLWRAAYISTGKLKVSHAVADTSFACRFLLQGCDRVSFGEYFLRHRRIVLICSSGGKQYTCNDTASHPRMWESSALPLWEPQNLASSNCWCLWSWERSVGPVLQ